MGTMRNNFAAVFVLHILMHLTSQSLPPPRGTNENSSKRNSLSELRSTSSPIYECLFLDPDLPICDEELMLKLAEEDSSSDQDNFGKNSGRRSTRNVHVSTTDVIVYTIEGCLPSKIPFSMPSCEGISLDKIVDVQKFRPFVVKGVTKPPLVFPKFNYREWQRMMMRLQNHVSPQTEFKEGQPIEQASSSSSVDRSVVQEVVRKQELMKAATKKEMMPNMMAVITTNSNDSSPNHSRILDDSKVGESVDRPAASTGHQFSDIVSRPASTSASVQDRSRDRIDNSTPDRSKFNVGENSEIPNTPPRYNPVAPPELSSNELLNYHNSDKFSESLEKKTSGMIARDDFPISRKTTVGRLRRTRLPATRNQQRASTDESRFRRDSDRGKAKRIVD